jgi:hypothetical protein
MFCTNAEGLNCAALVARRHTIEGRASITQETGDEKVMRAYVCIDLL